MSNSNSHNSHGQSFTTTPDNYPFAPAPDIIRSHQKDAYFQGQLLSHVSAMLRSVYGARFAHTYMTEARTFSDLLYHGLTTFLGSRTLGEEYCDIVQVEDDTLRLPAISRRAGYILTSILLPYGLTRILPAFRRRLRAKLESSLRRYARTEAPLKSQSAHPHKRKPESFAYNLQNYIHTNLDTLTSPTPLYAVTLAIFYFTGSYYQLSKRFFGLRYIFTKRLSPSEQRVGYEVLGVLLVLQMVVQGWLHVQQTVSSASVPGKAILAAGRGAMLDNRVDVSLDPSVYPNDNPISLESSPPQTGLLGISNTTHTPALDKPRYCLDGKETMQWIQSTQQRKCTLCLEPMKDPSVTTCGHVFCWTCIGDWVREKPECPLCRQVCLAQHILPLRE